MSKKTSHQTSCGKPGQALVTEGDLQDWPGVQDLRIWPRHLYSVPHAGRVGYCAAGARAWFAAHAMSWAEFVACGTAAATLLATGCPMARRLVEHAQALEAAQAQPEQVQHGQA